MTIFTAYAVAVAAVVAATATAAHRRAVHRRAARLTALRRLWQWQPPAALPRRPTSERAA